MGYIIISFFVFVGVSLVVGIVGERRGWKRNLRFLVWIGFCAIAMSLIVEPHVKGWGAEIHWWTMAKIGWYFLFIILTSDWSEI